MPLVEILIKKSQGGRESRDIHTNRYLLARTGAFSRAAVVAAMTDFASAEAGITFTATQFTRANYRELDADGHTVVGRSFSVPLNMSGAFSMNPNDVPAGEYIVLAMEKNADFGPPGNSYFRHCLTADEYGAFLATGVVPARFEVSPGAGFGAGQALADNLLAAATDNGFTLAMPEHMVNGVRTHRTVTSIEFGGFRPNDPNRPKNSAQVNIRHSVQQKLNELSAAVRLLSKVDSSGQIPPTATVRIGLIKAEAATIYATLDAIDAARVKFPSNLEIIP